MHTNHRRKNKGKFLTGFDYSHLNYVAQQQAGIGFEHDGGHSGAAKDRREIKAIHHRQERRRLNKLERNVEIDKADPRP